MGRLHRFYVPPDFELKQDFWLHDEALLHQWRKVLRYQVGQEVVLFDGVQHERLYRLSELNEREAHLERVTDLVRKIPSKEVYLLWSLLKNDKNDWLIQKGTELGVSHFMPLLSERAVATGFNEERARRISIEAAEQCGRSDIPAIRQPMSVETALKELQGKVTVYVCSEDGADIADDSDSVAVSIGPEGGWTQAELEVFTQHGAKMLKLHDFTLRAETAALAALSKFL